MEQHQKLRVLVRLDIDPQAATVQVRGCLTESSWETLLPILRRAGSLVTDIEVALDLRHADHLDASALDRLAESGLADQIMTPDIMPTCNAQAAAAASDITEPALACG